MKKCLIWGTGNVFLKHANLIKYHEMLGHFEVLGITSQAFPYSEWGGWNFFTPEERKSLEYDFVIVMAKGQIEREIIEEAHECGIPYERIFTYRILEQGCLDIDRLIKIRKTPLTIFSNTCWGGLTYHSLDMEFFSPLINMWMHESEFITFLNSPKYYIGQQLEFYEMRTTDSGTCWPIAKCGDLKLYFNHYKTFDEAEQSWEERKRKINWDNLFVEMCTEDRTVAEDFLKLPYEKKVCFVPFRTEEKELVYIPYRENIKFQDEIFAGIVNGMARGRYPYYDVLDLIENGKVTVKKEFI